MLTVTSCMITRLQREEEQMDRQGKLTAVEIGLKGMRKKNSRENPNHSKDGIHCGFALVF